MTLRRKRRGISRSDTGYMLAAVLHVAAAAAWLPQSMLTSRASSAARSQSVIMTMSGSRRAVLLGATSAALTTMTPQVAMAKEAVYNPPTGSLKGQTILITGANTGLGLESAKRLAAAGASLIVTARSQAKADGAAAAARAAAASTGASGKITPLELDLASLDSIKAFPTRLASSAGTDAAINVALLNAGVMAIPERLSTADGFERTIGVNHLGHFALVGELLPALKRASDGFRVVTVSSDAHRFVTPEMMKKAISTDLDPEYSAWGNYGLSKAVRAEHDGTHRTLRRLQPLPSRA